jgi:PqqD family protein of HPr-rel-A system
MKLRDDLATQLIDGELVIFNREAEQIHTLNQTASHIWQSLEQGMTLEQIVAQFVEDYGVDDAQAKTDIENTLKAFESLGLLAHNENR